MNVDRPLAGRTVLVTRPEDRGQDLVARLEALGARVLVRPTIALEPASDSELARRALREVDRYDLMIFTSAAGVDFFSDLLCGEGTRARRPRATIAAVGPGTARALRDAGLTPDLVAKDPSAEGLAELLGELDLRGKRVLVVRPEVAREVLPEALRRVGAEVDAVPFYRTVTAPGTAQTAAEVSRGGIDAVVFTSPSTFHRLLEAAGSGREALVLALRQTTRIAIGPVTADALRDAGLPAHAVAGSPASQAIADALVHALRPESR